MRNIGKTWAFKRRIWKRALKRGKKTIVVRRFKNEKRAAAETFYSSRDMQEFCGIEPYDPETKKGNMKQEGATFYIKRGNKWVWFLKIMNLAEYQNTRSADDVDCDTIIYDEYTTTPERYRLYRGNEVENFIDLSISICRQHPIRVIFCGNKESIDDPYLTYFGIKPLPTDFEGIRTYKKGTIVVQQVNTEVKQNAQKPTYLDRLKTMLEGTAYGRYMFEGEYKRASRREFLPTPSEAEGYLQLKWRDKLLCIKTVGDKFYVNNRPDISLTLFTDAIKDTHKYKRQEQLLKSEKSTICRGLIAAYIDDRVIYSSEAVYEAIQPFYKWLGILNQ